MLDKDYRVYVHKLLDLLMDQQSLYYSNIRELAGKVFVWLDDELLNIATLAERLENQTTGNKCIPETFEYDFACKVVEAAKTLDDTGKQALFVYTCINPDDLREYARGANEATREARIALYGY
jgi:hypothetical protein